MAPEQLVDRVDGRLSVDELVDHREPLVVRGERGRADPGLQGRFGGEPVGDISDGSGALDAVRLSAGLDQQIEDCGHAEHRGMHQRGPTGHATRIA